MLLTSDQLRRSLWIRRYKNTVIPAQAGIQSRGTISHHRNLLPHQKQDTQMTMQPCVYILASTSTQMDPRLRGDDVEVWITLGGSILNAAYVWPTLGRGFGNADI